MCLSDAGASDTLRRFRDESNFTNAKTEIFSRTFCTHLLTFHSKYAVSINIVKIYFKMVCNHFFEFVGEMGPT